MKQSLVKLQRIEFKITLRIAKDNTEAYKSVATASSWNEPWFCKHRVQLRDCKLHRIPAYGNCILGELCSDTENAKIMKEFCKYESDEFFSHKVKTGRTVLSLRVRSRIKDKATKNEANSCDKS